MRRLYAFISLFIAAISGVCGFTASAAVDSEGYPIFYLRGLEIGEWAASDAYLFTRTGSTYSIHLDALNGEFKIGDESWVYNFGSPENGQKYTVSASETITMLRNGENLIANNLSDVTITFDYVEGAETAQVMITVSGERPPVSGLSGTLPVLYINVYTDDTHTEFNNEIISKDLAHKDYFSFAEYWLDLNGCSWMEAEGAASIGSENEPLPLEIKARGNWTRKGFSKKPFKLKLGKKQSMLGMTKSKHFAILAHADDSWGYLRNFIGFNLGKRIELPWTPAQQPVEVVINGDYRGLYFLTESIRVGDDRIMITELADNETEPTLVSGGYVVELDNYDGDNQIRMEEKVADGVVIPYVDELRITWDTPEEYSDLQKQFITDQFSAMNDAVGAVDDKLWSYMDLDDAARYYIVEEIISHTESYHGSTYLFRDFGEGQKWHFSPLWDCGNAFSGPTDDYFYQHGMYGNTWIPSMRKSGKFNGKVYQTWLWFMQNQYPGLIDDIDSYVNHISEAAKADRTRWQNQPVPDGGQPVADNSDMASKRNQAVRHLETKIEWLRQNWGDFNTGSHPEPSRDDTPAAPLPDYVLASVADINVDATDANAPAIYYNLQGMRVSTLIPGHTYIRVSGSHSSKINVRP